MDKKIARQSEFPKFEFYCFEPKPILLKKIA